jgi:hypothetical protein
VRKKKQKAMGTSTGTGIKAARSTLFIKTSSKINYPCWALLGNTLVIATQRTNPFSILKSSRVASKASRIRASFY